MERLTPGLCDTPSFYIYPYSCLGFHRVLRNDGSIALFLPGPVIPSLGRLRSPAAGNVISKGRPPVTLTFQNPAIANIINLALTYAGERGDVTLTRLVIDRTLSTNSRSGTSFVAPTTFARRINKVSHG